MTRKSSPRISYGDGILVYVSVVMKTTPSPTPNAMLALGSGIDVGEDCSSHQIGHFRHAFIFGVWTCTLA